MDAFLDELYVLFSPRVYLLADVKPLVNESYHKRIDELCDKVRSGGGGGGNGGDSYSLPPALNAFVSSSTDTVTNGNGSMVASSGESSAAGAGGGAKSEMRTTSPLGGGSGSTSEAAVVAVAPAVVTGKHSLTINGAPSPQFPLQGCARGGVSGGGSGQSSKGNDELESILSLRWGRHELLYGFLAGI